jgi:hypothetical protein
VYHRERHAPYVAGERLHELEIGRAPDDEEAPKSLARSESPGVVRYIGPTAWSLIQGVARSSSSSLRASAARSRSAHYDTREGRALQR